MRTWIAGIGVSIAAIAVPTASSAGPVVLGDALSRVSLWCLSVEEASGDFPEAVDLSCERHPVFQGEPMGTVRAHLSSSFGDVLLTAADAACVSCPFPVSALASSRISFELVVAQHATPPRPLSNVPVRITASGEIGVSPLGLLGGGGAFLSSTLNVIFTQADVFAENLTTSPVTGAILADDFEVTETVDLTPGHVYFGNVYAGCNQFSSPAGDWACAGQAQVSFALDQQAFDASQGAETFDLAQYVSIQRSPNLVPEASELQLGVGALAALVLAARARSTGGASPQRE